MKLGSPVSLSAALPPNISKQKICQRQTLTVLSLYFYPKDIAVSSYRTSKSQEK